MPSRILHAAALTALTALAAGCDNSSSSTTSTTVARSTTTIPRADDGTLVVGAVLPTVGAAAEIGKSMTAALALAVREVNEAGGVNGRPLRLVVREEGENPDTALVSVQALTQLGVDVVIGPTSSLTLLDTLGSAVEAGVLTCAPTATALALDAFPDNGLLFRTIASDSLQAQAMARLVETTGAGSAAVVYLDDGYGRPFGQAARAAITRTGTGVAADIAFVDSEESLQQTAAAVRDADPDVVAVVADAVAGPRVIAAIDEITRGTLTFVVNDTGRRPDAAAEPYSADLASRIVGVSPQAYSTANAFVEGLREIDPTASGLFAQNAYDCLNAVALAAEVADSTQPADIATQLSGVTTSGTSCSSFPTCAAALAAGRNINYDGPSGTLAVGAGGEATSAAFERFGFDDAGRDVGQGSLVVGSG